MAKQKLIKIKVLKPVGQFEEGKDYEVTQEVADQICAPRTRNDGNGVEKFQCAITHADLEKIKSEASKSGLTQGELAELGIKNTVETPRDEAFEQRLQSLQVGIPGVEVTQDLSGMAQAKAFAVQQALSAKEKMLSQGA